MSLQDMDIYNGHLVLSVNKKGFPMLCSVNLPINFNYKVLLFVVNIEIKDKCSQFEMTNLLNLREDIDIF